MFLTAAISGTALHLGLDDICLRLLCAMIVGMVIGTEREYTHRPAGMRTHILVALGACAVMITGQLIFIQYKALGGNPDPSRLSAQVITGVGFLGAGTIMREGTNVKGLTTAASLWTVACLGIAAGGGYYAVALAGMVFILITLTILETLQHKLISPVSPLRSYELEVRDISAGLELVSSQVYSIHAGLRQIGSRQLTEDSWQITFTLEVDGAGAKRRQKKFFDNLAASLVVISVQVSEDVNSHAL